MAQTIDAYQLPSPSTSPALSSPSASTQHPRPLTQHHARPIPNSYWATPALLACEYPWAPSTPTPKLDALLLAGVRTFVDLTEPGELRPYAASALAARARAVGIDACSIEYFNFPIQDRETPPSKEFVMEVLAVLADVEARGRIAAVHCRGGIGRTGTIVGCWLVQRGSARYVYYLCLILFPSTHILYRDGEEALAMIAAEWATVEKCKRFPSSPETGAQCAFVRAWKECRGRDVAAC
jgi:atypical dual specificity phosphatase